MHLLPSYSALLAVLACATLLPACGRDTPATATVALPAALLETHGGWPHYGGDLGGTRFSAREQITPANVDQLQLAWTYNSGDLAPESFPDSFNSPAMQVTPILAQDTLYLCSPRNRIIALDPATGRERWHYAADPELSGLYSVTCRGVAYHADQEAAPGQACAARIVAGTLDGRLLALDASSGKPCDEFGIDGEVDLKAALGDVGPAEYALTSPPLVVNGSIVTGAHVADLRRGGVPSGVIRAFDARSGALLWDWEAVLPEQQLADSYTPGSPNAWAPLSADAERGLVFIPTGNPAGDYYGGERDGIDAFGSSVVALDSNTGERVWHFQAVHNDVWDYDMPSQPVLFDFPGPDGPIPALVQATKMGLLFVLNRETGEPLFPIEERAVPQGGPAPEALSPTQPWPLLPEPLHPTELTEEDMFGFAWFDKRACIKQFRELNYEGLYTPISTRPTLVYPGFMGGSNWGSVSWDPVRKLLLANTSRVPAIIELIPREVAESPEFAERVEPQLDTPYAVKRRPFLSPLGAPCNRPPWGVLTAIDMTSGKKAWEVPLGSTRDLAPFPLWLDLGVPNSGGSLVTASGLTFIGAATDSYLRAFATETGAELWKARLPAGGHATPMTYTLADGSQYVVIAAGGNRMLGSKMGDALVAFRLP
ncbi:pyrroloquinoline quinone-dependent dehydrogenase [Haliea sp. E1-2-M8]|uniref:pyrroloquinoline quinone-dependent dehydrogenase n=1 Tax=Haliea sp. E1-2-M8 TaxID=3064706 RepID=UPI0027263CC5|nr:pyrroloquinoline quinone-dependent dehydrogenase [Haliea sp. E1-2-M8]MDO8861911.1 pyrroloquinoline quinone-dependent dehydrogenase [Haliea sp. E1-2-M8]